MSGSGNMLPGYQAGKAFGSRAVVKGGPIRLMPVGSILAGSLSRDPLNTGYLDVIRAGTVVGKVTATKKYAPSIVAVTTIAYDKDGSALLADHLWVSVADAVEIVRRFGASGTFNISGPPTTGGVMATYETVTYSAVDTSTGDITITTLAADYIAGSYIQPEDGSEVPLALLNKEDGVKVTDDLGVNMDVAVQLLVGAIVDSSQILRWSANAVIIAWLKGVLNADGASQFVFDDGFI